MQALAGLLETPNPDDALVASIAEIYNSNRSKFNKIAKEYVDKVIRIFLECQARTNGFI